MHSLHPELTRAMAEMLDRMDASLRQSGYSGDAIRMFLAGGMAVHFHCGTRYTEDVDASFSRRMLLPTGDLAIDYKREDGTPSTLYFDANYNDTFALMHPDHQENAVEWQGIGNELRVIQLFVLAPLDLAVSKLARFAQQDREDIHSLAGRRYFTGAQLRSHAAEALDYYVGDTARVRGTIDLICNEISSTN